MVKIKHARLVAILSFCNYDVSRLHPDADRSIRVDPTKTFAVLHSFMAESLLLTSEEANLLIEFGVLDVVHEDEPGSDLEVLAQKLRLEVVNVRSTFNGAIKKLGASSVLEERLSDIGLPTVGLHGRKDTHVRSRPLQFPNTFLALERHTPPLSTPRESLAAY